MNTKLTFIKKNIIILILIVVGLILLVLACNILPKMGYIREDNPLLSVPSYFSIIQWGMLFSSIVLTVIGIIVWRISSKRKPICISILIILLIMGAIFGYSETKFSKFLEDNNAVSEIPQDIDENYSAITLNTLEGSLASNSEGLSVYYISRIDCPACKDFEKSLTPFLDESSHSMNTYFTNSDRDGIRSEEMYAILDKYGIAAVPAVIIKKDGKVVDLFLDPKSSLNKIKDYFSEESKN